MSQVSRVISIKDFKPSQFRWLTLKLIEWRDPAGKLRLWESAERTTRSASGVDAVAIVAKAMSRLEPARCILVSQFRPPLDAICLEMPAGLIDEGEDAGAAALRELKEETGYTGRLLSVSPLCLSDPGMSNANMQLACLEIDLDAPENKHAVQSLDDGECIKVEMAPWGVELLPWLIERKKTSGYAVDARLLSFAVGLSMKTL